MTAQTFELTITDLHRLKRNVLWVTLSPREGFELPHWSPGAHIGVHLTDDLIRQYSLCGDSDDQTVYRIAVQLEPESRGGSQFIHENWKLGQAVTVEAPRNNFELVEAPSYLFIAGGIGITPLLPMIKKAEDEGRIWALSYRGRSRQDMPFANSLVRNLGDNVTILASDEGNRLSVKEIVGEPVPGRAIYCCGPTAMLDDAEALARSSSLAPDETMHLERFVNAHAVPDDGDHEFDVELAQSGRTLTVPADKTVIDTLEEAGVDVSYSCREGTCGTCETEVLEGEVDHRDSILDDDEKAANDCMFICVSRCKGKRLVLDL
ncbi:PDR/VanB family oxidoreductase [Brevibacterium daeguense]|uniref:PDR/VanB family oxidoreductase n=1 Tax=Brevibacterium daeguense TaxID=909936 RepID=A0ABP8EF86_9MICO|nr:PDR/VanB family oxidoreductase [Brevibacterium daeguense]